MNNCVIFYLFIHQLFYYLFVADITSATSEKVYSLGKAKTKMFSISQALF